jgi:hypothetical protein
MDGIRMWLEAVDPPLLWWVGGSILAYALVTNLAWWLRPRLRLHPVARAALVQAARFAFYLGVPYLALGGWPRPPFSGLISLDDLGLVGLSPLWPAARWLGSAGTGLALGLAAFLVLLLGWWNANRAGARLRFPPGPWWALLIDGLYLQVHWAFYRAAPAAALGDVYAGVFLGLGLVVVEWALDPAWRQGWREPEQAAERWLRVALAVTSALIFWFTRSLWACLAVHWALDLALWHLGREKADRIHRIVQDLQEPL